MAPPRRTSAASSASGSYSLQSYDRQSLEQKRNSYDDEIAFASGDDDHSVNDPILHTRDSLPRPERRAPTAMSSYRYRVPNRIMRYLCFGLAASILIFIFSLFRASANSERMVMELNEQKMKEQQEQDKTDVLTQEEDTYNSLPRLSRYFGGLRTLTAASLNKPEFPREAGVELNQMQIDSESMRPIPPSDAYSPYPDYNSPAYVAEFGQMNGCFLDEAETVRPPKIHAFSGVPLGMPDSAYGSYELLGLNGSVCLDRYARYGAYGYGYSKSKGGLGIGLRGEREGADRVWDNQQQIDYSGIDWASMQRKCAEKNAHRFRQSDVGNTMHNWRSMKSRVDGASDVPSWLQPFKAVNSTARSDLSGVAKIPRQAVIIRTWSDFEYREDHILSLRSMISELSLSSGGEFDVFLLVHVKDQDAPIWADDATYQRMLNESLPEEFRGIGILWSESQMATVYRGIHDEMNREGFPPVLGVYRTLHLSLAYFSKTHPEYEFVWNLEMDIRYIGNWYHLLTSIGDWASKQPRKGLWERNHRFYVPHVHGSWEDFTQMVRVQTDIPAPGSDRWSKVGPDGKKTDEEPYIDEPVWGPQWAEGDERAKPFDDDPAPPTTYDKDKYEWGVGEDADLISFHPLFDPARTSWTIQRDFNGYNLGDTGTKGAFPPRRVAIVAAGRLSRRLLDRMHRETAIRKHSMFTEMFPPTMALHHGLKAVFAPHPVFVDRDWSLKDLVSIFNSGPKGVTGRHERCVFGDCCQHKLQGMSWHYNAYFAGDLYKKWWGIQDEQEGSGPKISSSEGRMCLPPILFHPIKDVPIPLDEPS